MDLVLVVLLVLAVGAVVAVALGRVGGGLADVPSAVSPPLEGGVRTASDLDRARFGLALRGYRMDQVDEVLDAAREAIAARDAEISRLRGEHRSRPDARPDATPATGPAPDEPAAGAAGEDR